MAITSQTQLCISIAARPGRYGITVHNAGYRTLGLDFVYKACTVTDLPGAIAGVRALGIRGCSVSMPFKEQVMPLLDELDETAHAVGAVNTIVNEGGKLTGYNTDVAAAKRALERVRLDQKERVLLIGAGGVARAIRHALFELGANRVYVTTREEHRAARFVRDTPFEATPWQARGQVRADVVVHATSIGMTPDEESQALSREQLEPVRALVEIVATPAETRLLRDARLLQKTTSTGPDFSLDQAAAQFELYTGREAPRDAMAHALRALAP